MAPIAVEIDGAAPAPEQVHAALARNDGHFTSMQVHDGTVRGFELHLRRLTHSSHELFGHQVDPERVRALLRHALRTAPSEVSVRINVFPTQGDDNEAAEPDVMVAVSPPVSGVAAPPWQVRTTAYERELAHIKHVGFFGVLHQRRLAHAAGYDDPLFVDRHGRVSEGAIWNVCFWDGEEFVFPEAAVLPGITMQILVDELARDGVPVTTRSVAVDDLVGFRAALATYSSCPAQPISRIDEVELPDHQQSSELLTATWHRTAPERI
ncbi:branched-subunit amino acid aminotransferase/4-amino-4-deoxychorismate lyase [Saccharopolyspora lacisalsi]|uniref:Branched-subunit amino acid aminotransferase/4-amino-4-deoxychorismate lyase n=1 Tax=Halosaccharopolyspora lacisalsi TaxID=1000566 RepID=A0A839DXG4_9PSEU|nr:aminotransferase class IV [Halosaccharopolyspora lacisalsi]MBA8824916.1 branched-subunit amino acid aminotransferase/4-amino-4-deoxychorismate lyase [Halosaccharopolyspora lacisalsi]